MFPPFPQGLARHYCQKIISLIEDGKVELRQTGRVSEERKDQGLMIGCLVCWNPDEKRRVLLFAVSGNNKQLNVPAGLFNEETFFVPSLVSSEKIDQALEENDREIHLLTEKINSISDKKNEERQALCKKRTALTDASLKKVFSLYDFTDFHGQKISLDEIIERHGMGRCGEHGGRLPPTGTGDCCAPKLLSCAFEKGLQIVSMDEVYFGKSTAQKKSGSSYPPCNGRCGYILPYIMGLEILYQDKDLVIINKASGLLSVPGKGEDKQDCAESRIRRFFPQATRQCAVHRLDMETSGILIAALNTEAHRKLNEDFAQGRVHKKYIALLDGILHGKPEGRIELKTRVDIDNRPHQILDEENGKTGITEWKKVGVEPAVPEHGRRAEVTRIEFSPETGRTHQLRMAAATPIEKGGLGIPIAGDSLYGKCMPGQRLMLHACEIEFRHPTSGKLLHIICPPEF